MPGEEIVEDNTLQGSVVEEPGTQDGKFFDEETGLWKFPCRSQHKPSEQGSSKLRINIIIRDSWTDMRLERDTNGMLIGPALAPLILEEMCGCGSGWLNEQGQERTVKSQPKHLTIYTTYAPVKCEVHSRLCCNLNNPCQLPWLEGEEDSIHVLSRETAAGDEIGYEFMSLVTRSGCTFAGYCQLKYESYKLRHRMASFMDPGVFIKWWFSWAASMKIAFRVPCEICKYQPKRLVCDGTRIGVGFRHATFEDVNTPESSIPKQQTLHRRLDRCLLKNMPGRVNSYTSRMRVNLDYLARKTLGEDITNDGSGDDDNRIRDVKEILPHEMKSSFERFCYGMDGNEKHSYAQVLKMLATTAATTSLLPAKYTWKTDHYFVMKN